MEFLEFIRLDILWNYRELFIRGVWVTIGLTIVGYTTGLILGLIFGLGRMSTRKWLHYPSKYYIDFFRGTPLLVQILLIHLAVIPTIFGKSLGFFVSGAVALSMNCGAYTAEIIRAGIESLDKGQMEAARSLGMPHRMAMRYIILPQALRRMVPPLGNELIALLKDSVHCLTEVPCDATLPPLGNELIALLKDSSLVTVIAATDILYAAKVVQGASLRVWEPYILAAILYLILTWVVTKLVAYIERRYSTSYVPKRSKRRKLLFF